MNKLLTKIIGSLGWFLASVRQEAKSKAISYKSYQEEVLDLFGQDPLCRWMISLYCRLSFWQYAIFWFFIMALLPCLFAVLDHQFWGSGRYFTPNYITIYSKTYQELELQRLYRQLLVTYLPRILFPIIFSGLGYFWFKNIVKLFYNLGGQRSNTEKYLSQVRERMNHPLLYGLTIIMTWGIGKSIYSGYWLYSEDIVILSGSLLWWYFILRTAEMKMLVFWNFKEFIENSQAAKRINLCHPENGFGLKSVVSYTYWFLLVYILVFGGYLLCYELILNTSLSLISWPMYLLISVYFYWKIIRPTSKIFERKKLLAMSKYSSKMLQADNHEDYHLFSQYRQQYDWVKSLKLFDFSKTYFLGQIIFPFLAAVINLFQLQDLIKETISQFFKLLF